MLIVRLGKLGTVTTQRDGHNRTAMHESPDRSSSTLNWDIFCQVIDNLGDLGVCWRLAANLAQRGHSVRLRLDQPQALDWMAPGLHPNVSLVHWQHDGQNAHPADQPLHLGDVVVAAFSCELDQATLSALGQRAKAGQPCVWFNLEYLSAESFSERSHGKPAPLLRGPAYGAPRLAYYPGFTPATGGLLREPGLAAQQSAFDRRAWLERHGVQWRGQRLVSLFCYEPLMLPDLLAHLALGDQETVMLVCAGRCANAARAALADSALARHAPDQNAAESTSVLRLGQLTLHFLPYLTQTGFDHLLWACDLNLVRGEDSLVRAIWAGRAFVWQIYPQDDNAHHAKLTALLDRMDAPASLRAFTLRWNGMEDGASSEASVLVGIAEPKQLAVWSAATLAWRQVLLAQTDLCSQLIERAKQEKTPG